MSTIFYKATRPDGTDFYTGTLQYAPGKRVRPHPHDGERKICGPGVLHAADVPAMTLVGGSWPCRLFEVTGKPIVGFDEQQQQHHRHKGGFKQLTVVREIDAHLALGPNGRYVAGIIERTRQLTYEEATNLRAAWGAAWGAAWDAAWDAARDAARGAAGDAAWDAARDVAWGAAWGAAWDAARGAARSAARDVAGDAALALLVQDLITPEQFDRLYGPWASVIDAKDGQL